MPHSEASLDSQMYWKKLQFSISCYSDSKIEPDPYTREIKIINKGHFSLHVIFASYFQCANGSIEFLPGEKDFLALFNLM